MRELGLMAGEGHDLVYMKGAWVRARDLEERMN